MKIRNGFISNSSSSSFVIAFDQDVTPKAHIKLEADLTKYADREFTTVEGYDAWFKDYYGEDYYEDDDGLCKLYNTCIKELKKGRTVMYCEVGNDDDTIGNILHDEGIENFIDPKEVTIILPNIW